MKIKCIKCKKQTGHKCVSKNKKVDGLYLKCNRCGNLSLYINWDYERVEET